MPRSADRRARSWLPRWISITGCVLTACNSEDPSDSLSKGQEDRPLVVAPIPADGPRLGAVSDVVQVLSGPKPKQTSLGYLHAGATVARSTQAYGTEGCAGGWYAIRPRGFVCATQSATLDLEHPTLAAMALKPKLDAPLPYTYARTVKETPLFERDEKRDHGVIAKGTLKARARMAIVGSWSAEDSDGKTQRLGLMTNGLFVRADDLKAAEPSTFHGVELTKETELPIAFVVKRGVSAWELDGGTAKKKEELDYHDTLRLTGRYRTVGEHKFWALDEQRWVRHRDVTVVRRRHVFPDFATETQKWLDISVVTGTLVLYEGKHARFTTLVSVGRDRLGDPKTSASTALGTFEVTAKHITDKTQNELELGTSYQVYDVPWVLELSSGQALHAAYWHDRFGIEHSPGAVHLSPADAARIWRWADPALPEGWHSAKALADSPKTLVNIRK